jgi:hypothetical protein
MKTLYLTLALISLSPQALAEEVCGYYLGRANFLTPVGNRWEVKRLAAPESELGKFLCFQGRVTATDKTVELEPLAVLREQNLTFTTARSCEAYIAKANAVWQVNDWDEESPKAFAIAVQGKEGKTIFGEEIVMIGTTFHGAGGKVSTRVQEVYWEEREDSGYVAYVLWMELAQPQGLAEVYACTTGRRCYLLQDKPFSFSKSLFESLPAWYVNRGIYVGSPKQDYPFVMKEGTARTSGSGQADYGALNPLRCHF